MYYPQELVEQVIEANNIVDVISQYVKLSKKGSTYFGLCPFHNEKTGSFSVTDRGDKKLFYCFGCHAGGSVLTFLMKYEGLEYTDALKQLADRAGIKLPEPHYSAEESEKRRLRDQIREVYKLSAVYYYHLLKSDRGAQAMSYLKKRELSDETILKFGLGYADKYRDDLYRYIKSKGFSDDILKSTGLFSIRETDIHDYFWNRVMFPIMDTGNRVIAFGGRVMGDGEPKYLNSPETVVFEKRKNLFGLHIARKTKKDALILCEGYMDVIMLHQAGFTNAVASLGTALTVTHASILKKYTSKVLLSYDSDNAGKNAALRAIPILRSAGLSVKIINLSPYKDPDELIKAESAAEYENRIKNARNSFLFEIDMLKETFDMEDPDSKTKFYHQTAKRLSTIEDEIERDNYIETVSREFEIPFDLLNRRVKHEALHAEPNERYQPVIDMQESKSIKEPKVTAQSESERIVLSYLVDNNSFLTKLSTVLSADDFSQRPYDKIAQMLYRDIAAGQMSISGILASFEETSDQEKAADLFRDRTAAEQEGEQDVSEIHKQINQCVLNIKQYALEQRADSMGLIETLNQRKQLEQLKKTDLLL